MRRARLSTILSVAAMAATLHAQGLRNPSISTDLNRRGASVDRLHVWVESIRQRDSGNTDEAVARVAPWTSVELDDLWIELQTLHELIENPRQSTFNVWVDSPRGEVSRRVAYTGSELNRLRRLALSLGGRDDRRGSTPDYDRQVLAARNRMLKRGALLHTDVTLTNPRDVRTEVSPFSTRREANILFADGRQVGVDRAANQWKFARVLLGLVRPTASADSGVRAWYRHRAPRCCARCTCTPSISTRRSACFRTMRC